jgi:hypothetical protein
MRGKPTAWRKSQQNTPVPAKGSLEEDVLAIRGIVLGPGSRYSIAESDAFPFRMPPGPHPYLMSPSLTTVTLPGGRTDAVAISRSPASLSNVLFFNEDHEAFLQTLMKRFGAVEAQFFAIPRQAGAPAGQLLTLILEFFPIQPGALPGWGFAASPTINSIRFDDEARGRADVSVGNEHITLVKRDGLWTAGK